MSDMVTYVREFVTQPECNVAEPKTPELPLDEARIAIQPALSAERKVIDPYTTLVEGELPHHMSSRQLAHSRATTLGIQ